LNAQTRKPGIQYVGIKLEMNWAGCLMLVGGTRDEIL